MAQNRFAVSAWPLRRKLALALAIPMLLAAVFGALRVQTELEQAANYTASASQVTVLPPAVAYLSAAEQAAVVSARPRGSSPEEREAAIAEVNDAAVDLEKAARLRRPHHRAARGRRHAAAAVQPAAQRGRLRQPGPVRLAGPPAPPRRHRAHRHDRQRPARPEPAARAPRPHAGRSPVPRDAAAPGGRTAPPRPPTPSSSPPRSASRPPRSTASAWRSAPRPRSCCSSSSRTRSTSAA